MVPDHPTKWLRYEVHRSSSSPSEQSSNLFRLGSLPSYPTLAMFSVILGRTDFDRSSTEICSCIKRAEAPRIWSHTAGKVFFLPKSLYVNCVCLSLLSTIYFPLSLRHTYVRGCNGVFLLLICYLNSPTSASALVLQSFLYISIILVNHSAIMKLCTLAFAFLSWATARVAAGKLSPTDTITWGGDSSRSGYQS